MHVKYQNPKTIDKIELESKSIKARKWCMIKNPHGIGEGTYKAKVYSSWIGMISWYSTVEQNTLKYHVLAKFINGSELSPIYKYENVSKTDLYSLVEFMFQENAVNYPVPNVRKEYNNNFSKFFLDKIRNSYETIKN